MKKIIPILVGLIVLGGVYFYATKNRVAQDQPLSILSEAQARVIAEKSCIKGGGALQAGEYNATTKTWSYAANLNATREGYTPECVVIEEKGTAEVVWHRTTPAKVGETTEFAGTVTAIDLVPMTYDGPALITLKNQLGITSIIAVPARIALCAAYKANKIGDVSLIKIGDEFEVRGEVIDNGSIIPCESADHYLQPKPFVATDFEGEADPARMTLSMKPWTWISAQYNDGRQVKPLKPGKFVLTFEPGQRFSIATDCNNGGGKYAVTPSKTITFSEIMATQMFCEGSQEGEFAKMLQSASSYHFTSKGELILDLKFDSGTVTFR